MDLCRPVPGGPVFADLKPALQGLMEAGTLSPISQIGLQALIRVGFTPDELAVLLADNQPGLAEDLERALRDAAFGDCWR